MDPVFGDAQHRGGGPSRGLDWLFQPGSGANLALAIAVIAKAKGGSDNADLRRLSEVHVAEHARL